MPTKFPYSGVFVAGRLTVGLWERSINEEDRKLEVRVDDESRGILRLSPWYLPRLSIGQGELLIWGGSSLYALDLAGGPFRHFELDDEIRAAYQLSSCWCFVCETSVLLWNSANGEVLAECQYNEVILKSWWAADQLFVEDFQNRRFEVRIDTAAPQLSFNPIR